MTRRETAQKHVAQMRDRITGGYHPGYTALVNDWEAACFVVAAVGSHLEDCPKDVREMYRMYQEGQGQ